MSDGARVRIEELPAAAIEEVEPLWSALREHHAAAAPEYGPPRSREASWAIRSTQYAGWLEAGGFVLVARAEERGIVGYAFVRIAGPGPIWTSDASGELATLSVLPEARGLGVGRALIAAVREQLAARDLDSMSIMVLNANYDGMRFYQREGFQSVTQTYWGSTQPYDASEAE